mgnify:CR=1 FL=1
MNKKFIALALCTATAGAMVTVLATKKGGNSFGTLAGDDCEGYHYAQVDPTKSTAGHREFWVCCKHHEISLTQPGDGRYVDQDEDKMVGGLASTHAAYLPVLNETDYTLVRSLETSRYGKMTETWTLKDATSGAYTQTNSYNAGYVIVSTASDDNKAGKFYLPEEFNKAFEGLELSFDKETMTTTLNVTKEDGYTLEDKVIHVVASVDNEFAFIITTYYPDLNYFNEDLKTRR